MNKKYDAIIVGSGAGGGTLAAELSKNWHGTGKSILVIEAGPFIKEGQDGDFLKMVILPGAAYSRMAAFNQSKEGVTIYQTRNVGGTTVVNCGNMVRSCQKEFAEHGIELEQEFKEAEKDVGVIPCETVIKGTKVIAEAAISMGENMYPMPKGRYSSAKCDACGNCVLGCSQRVKWDSRSHVSSAIDNGVDVLASTKVKKVLFSEAGKAEGVQIGNSKIESDLVILAAGGLSTPVVLQNSGVKAGEGLFVDYFNVTYGIIDSSSENTVNQLKGASMGTVITDYHNSDGYVLAPFMDHWSQFALMVPKMWNIIHGFPHKRVLGIMAKITDDRVGQVFKNGKVSKFPTSDDLGKLNAGAFKASEILKAAGTRNIVTTSNWHRGAHPGGTAAVGEVIDNNLMVKDYEGLYVCDASVFPVTPGLPPILTIVALAKWLGKRL